MKKEKSSKQFAIQLEIDFLLPFELTPTLEDLRYEFELSGSFSTPYSVVEFKKKIRKRKK